MIRKTCFLCDSNDLQEIYSLKEFPVYMGSTKQKKEDDLYEDLTFVKCGSCGSGQIKNLIPLDVLYKDSHNTATGATWKLHHDEFLKFATEFASGKIIEIGGANLVVANSLASLEATESITVYDNNIHYENIKSEKIIPKEEFFSSQITTDNKGVDSSPDIDCVIHTHLLEHLYNPIDELKTVSKNLKPGGYMIFSAPHIDAMLKKFYTNAMNFEHTFLLCETKIKKILNASGFKILKSKAFSEFCFFYACQKVANPSTPDLGVYNEDGILINDFVDHHVNEVSTILSKIDDEKENTFIFGAHIFTQYLLKFGLDENLFSSILDNDKNKIGNRLYGTGLQISSPSVLKDLKSPLVVLKAAQYTEEIKDDIIKNINSSTRFIL